eukprot:TRINITY_DN4093_c0_g2_i4.p1 TRINITY_DN4093_c0_g2~~TRINITY_DN4093_c0_g2_i4.p1  ORF type:complete len:531 (-),score=175.47 TRINITY_DN4093_c0_g2_i4:719-2311(-)
MKNQTKKETKIKFKPKKRGRPRKNPIPDEEEFDDMEEDEKESEVEEEVDDDFGDSKPKKKNLKEKKVGKYTKKERKEVKMKRVTKIKPSIFDKEYVDKLASLNVENYWASPEGARSIDLINVDNPLTLQHAIDHQGAIYGMKLSPDYQYLATCTNLGSIQIWDTKEWKLVTELRDRKEKEIDEFFVMNWTDDGKHIIVGGKLKCRKMWSNTDEDNHILPCPIKIFNTESGEVVERLEGHQEEVLCLKRVVFKETNYLLSGSEEGFMIKWEMNEDYSKLVNQEKFDDMTTNMIISMSFVPNTGNKYFLISSDEHIKLFDFEEKTLVAAWDNNYSYLCDCVKFIEPFELPVTDGQFYLLSKGVELLDDDDSSKVMHRNKCILHKLSMPGVRTKGWCLEEVQRFEHDEYQANLWMMQLASNGRYLAAPTTVGKIFIWNLKSQTLTAVLKNGNSEIRDIMFHPKEPLLFSCGDESKIYVWNYEKKQKPVQKAQVAVPQSKGVVAQAPTKQSSSPVLGQAAKQAANATKATPGIK